ncbi:MAG: MBOAT family protein, partial [Magnetospirillum sp.]
MTFTSLSFVIFYGVVLVAYHLAHRSLHGQNLLLIAASAFFYGWWDWRFLALLALTTGTDFIAAKVMEDLPRWRRAALVCSVSMNLGALFFFKYAEFFVRSFVNLGTQLGLQLDTQPLGLILPIGISFYTFQSIAYTVDVFRGTCRAERDPTAYFAYVTFFPQLVAGPIERAGHMLAQFK